MNLRTAALPAGATAALAGPLSHLMGGPPDLGACVRGYTLGLDAMVAGKGLEGATDGKWHVLLLAGGKPAAVADIRDTPGGPTLASVAHGRFAERLAEALELAAREHGADAEARVLHVPALCLAALWLHGDGEVFIPLLGDGPVAADPCFLAGLEPQRRAA